MNGGTSDGAVELVEFRPLVAEDDGGETSKEAEDTLCEAAAAGEESSEELQTTGEDRLPEDEVKLIREPSDIDENGVVTEYEVALKYVGFGLYHVLLFLVNGVALASDAVEVLSISFVLSSSMGEEFGLTEAQNAWLSSIIFLGMLFGSYLWGTLADLVGRRSTLLTSLTVNGVFGMVSAFSPNYVFFLFCRFLSGLGVGGSLPIITSYNSELIRNKYRGPYLGMTSVFWMLGSLQCAGLAWLIIPSDISFPLGTLQVTSWRVFLFCSAIPALLGAILYFFLPESPRFLIEVNKTGKALKVLKIIHRLNHLRTPNKEYPVKGLDIKVHSSQVDVLDSIGGSTLRARCLSIAAKLKEVLRRTVQLYRRKLLVRTILLSGVLFCLSFGSYGVTLWYPSYVKQLDQAESLKSLLALGCNGTISQTNQKNQSNQSNLYDQLCGCSLTSVSGAQFEDLNVTDWQHINASFTQVSYERTRFSNVTFKGVNFTELTFRDSTLDSVGFYENEWFAVRFEGVQFSNVEFCDVLVVPGLDGYGLLEIDNRSSVIGSNVSVDGQLVADAYDLQRLLVGKRREQEREEGKGVGEGGEGEEEGESGGECVGERFGSVSAQCSEEVDEGRVYRASFFVPASALPGNVISAIAVYFMRRNWWMAISMFLSTGSIFLLYFVHSEAYTVVILCVFTFFSTPAWNDSSLLIAELYPTHLRTTAMGVHFLMVRVGAIFGTNLFGEFIRVNPSIPILTVATVLCIGGCLSLGIPKTTRKTLLG